MEYPIGTIVRYKTNHINIYLILRTNKYYTHIWDVYSFTNKIYTNVYKEDLIKI